MSIGKGLIIIPAYNESGRIEKVLAGIKNENEILVIDDGSTDDIKAATQGFNITYIKNEKRYGVSYCTKMGFSYAKKHNFEFVITIDADGQHDPSYIGEFVNAVGDSQLVIGNRFSSIENIPTSKMCSNCFASVLIKHCFGIHIADVSCGYRGYSLKMSSINYLKEFNCSEYEVIYDFLIRNIVSHSLIKTVNIPCIYYPQDLWNTRRKELVSLINAVKRFSSTNKILDYIENEVRSFNQFQVSLEGISFFFHRVIENDSYFIQANIADVEKYYKELCSNV